MSPSKFADEASHDAEIKVPPGETDFGERALAVVGQRGDLACRVIAIDVGFSGQRRPRPPHCDSTFDQAFCERSEEHTSELQSLMRISYAVFCLKKKTKRQ